MYYPDNHKEIVTSLLEGKFITADEENLFSILQKENEFYSNFFEKSFGYELKETHDYYYLVSNETSENTSRDIAIFFAVFCYELDKDGRNFLDELDYSEFKIEEISAYFENSSWSEIVKANKQLNSHDAIKRLLGTTMYKRNIVIKQPANKYSFTKAYKLFLNFAKDLLKEFQKKKKPTPN